MIIPIKIFNILLILLKITLVRNQCPIIKDYYKNATDLFTLEYSQNSIREGRETITDGSDKVDKPENAAEIFTIAAMLAASRQNVDLSSPSCLVPETSLESHSKYRTIDGYGNNLQNPSWGASSSPFERLGPKNYFDDIYTIRKTYRNSERLPNPRDVVDKVLFNAPKASRVSNIPNMIFLGSLGMIQFDTGFSNPRRDTKGNLVKCCATNGTNLLPKAVANPFCIPVRVSINDPFYRNFNVRCLSQTRSEIISSKNGLQFGEIKNLETSFLDLSHIYDFDKPSSDAIRTFTKGNLRLDPSKIIPLNADGSPTAQDIRMAVGSGLMLTSVLYLRQHNKIADELARLNPTWDDEKLFQEARRLNIAIFQKLITSYDVIKLIFGKNVLGTISYDPTVKATTTVEFLQGVLRLSHAFIPDQVILVDDKNVARKVPVSDTSGNFNIPQNFYDDLIRGGLTNPINFRRYSEEMHNKVMKNKAGFGIDIFSYDIQRGRDHGLPTYVQMLKKIDSNANFTTFRSLKTIFSDSTIASLDKVYDTVRDVDLIVGGSLESFKVYNRQLFGPTMSYIFQDHFNRIISGDAYFYSHSTNPNPFTPSQLAAINSMTFNHLICSNSNVRFGLKYPLLVQSAKNPRVPCTNFKFIDLTPWVGV